MKRARWIFIAVVVALAVPASAEAAPVVTYDLSGTPGSNGWWVSTVVVHWHVSSDATNTTGCEPAVSIGYDTSGVVLTCRATGGGTTTVQTDPIRIDTTPPTATGAATTRAPDFGGWFNHPVTVVWSGRDAMSGLASCDSITYSGPDSGTASLGGRCRDNAGNVSAPLGFTFAYDATPPSLSGLAGTGGDTTAALSWKPSADTQSVSVVRAPGSPGAAARAVYSGAVATSLFDRGLTNGVRYTYTVTAYDAAGNAASQSVAVRPFSMLVSPLPGAAISRARVRKSPPALTWQPRTGANYYNVQLFLYVHRHWRKVLSKWPTKNHLQLHRAWIYGGKRRQLIVGHYRWYVWPGYGAESRRRYGKLLGTRDFFITR